MTYNQVTLIGNLVRDPERRNFRDTAITEITLALNERRKKPDGEIIDDVSYIDVVAYGRLAETLSEYTRKGNPVLVSGKLKQERWEKDGQKFSRVRVVALSAQLFPRNMVNGTSAPSNGRVDLTPATATSSTSEEFPDDDVPF